MDVLYASGCHYGQVYASPALCKAPTILSERQCREFHQEGMRDAKISSPMAKRKSKKRDAENYRALIKWVSAILLIALGLILLLGAFGLAGIAGAAIFGFAFGGLGVGAFLLPVIIILIGVAIMIERMLVSPLTAAGIAIIVFSTLTLLGILTQNLQHNLGGTAGLFAGHAAEQFFGLW